VCSSPGREFVTETMRNAADPMAQTRRYVGTDAAQKVLKVARAEICINSDAHGSMQKGRGERMHKTEKIYR